MLLRKISHGIYEIGALRSKKLLPVFEANKGKKGRLSLQVNAKYYRNKDKMVEQAVKINSLAPNMQVKIPASAAGVEAMEEATYRGISINATVSFTVAQAVAVAKAVERGLKRREAEGLDNSQMAPICTIMIGRTDDWLKKNTTKTGQVVLPEVLEWSGVVVQLVQDCLAQQTEMFTTGVRSLAVTLLRQSTTPGTNV